MEEIDFNKLIDRLFEKNEVQAKFFQNNQILFSVVGDKGKLTFVSDSWSKCLGLTKKQIQSIPFAVLIHPNDLPLSNDLYEYRLKTGKSGATMYSNKYRKIDGTYAHILWFEGIRFKEKDVWLNLAIEIPVNQPQYIVTKNSYVPFGWEK